MQEDPKILIDHVSQLHTTELGIERIKKNLKLTTEDVIQWCQAQVLSPKAEIQRNGKNWYVRIEESELTINAYSYTVITAHRMKQL